MEYADRHIDNRRETLLLRKQVVIPASLHMRVKRKALDLQMDMQDLVTMAIAQWLDGLPPGDRRSVKRPAQTPTSTTDRAPAKRKAAPPRIR